MDDNDNTSRTSIIGHRMSSVRIPLIDAETNQPSGKDQSNIDIESYRVDSKPRQAIFTNIWGRLTFPWNNKKQPQKWRMSVRLGCVVSIVALLCNCAAVAYTRPNASEIYTQLLFSGDCSQARSIDFWLHAAINIVSTALLCGSNYAGQVLVAPNRNTVNNAHTHGRSVDIGVASLRNWSSMDIRRRILYTVLFCTTLPLHLVYNSVVYSSTSAFNVRSSFVSRDFCDTSITALAGSGVDDRFDEMSRIQSAAIHGHLQNLTTTVCEETLSQQFISDYSNVLLFTNETSSWLNASWFGGNFGPMGDLVSPSMYNSSTEVWLYNVSGTPVSQVQIDYCLGDKAPASCTVSLVPALLYTVIVCNLLKAIVLALVSRLHSNPLLTVGDGIASFMETPDGTTRGMGSRGVKAIRSHIARRRNVQTPFFEPKQWKPRRRAYGEGAPRSLWFVTLLCSLSSGLFAFVILMRMVGGGSSVTSPSFAQQWQQGFGSVITSAVAELQTSNIVLLILLANSPQLLLSFLYLLYNNLVTSMALTLEWTTYAVHRKSLRVTTPRGEQRSTYFLSLPYRYSMPLVIGSVVLHWMLSQSLFLAQVDGFLWDGSPLPELGIHTVGWSSLGLTMFVVTWAILISAVLFFAWCIWFEPGIPLARCNSLVISAACHPVSTTGEPESLKKLKYGVISQVSKRVYHVGFSSGPVRELVADEYYE